jgi:hypothetical protein
LIGSTRSSTYSHLHGQNESCCLSDGDRFLLTPRGPCGHRGSALLRTHRAVKALNKSASHPCGDFEPVELMLVFIVVSKAGKPRRGVSLSAHCKNDSELIDRGWETLVGFGSTANAGYATERCSMSQLTASCEDVTSSRSRLVILSALAEIRSRTIVIQQKSGRPVQFELLEPARGSIRAWLEHRGGTIDEFAFPSRIDHTDHISTRQYARLVDEWVTGIGLRPEDYGTHSLRRTKASIIYKQTGNLRAALILLGHTKIESTVRYLGVDVEDALALAEGTEV